MRLKSGFSHWNPVAHDPVIGSAHRWISWEYSFPHLPNAAQHPALSNGALRYKQGGTGHRYTIEHINTRTTQSTQKPRTLVLKTDIWGGEDAFKMR